MNLCKHDRDPAACNFCRISENYRLELDSLRTQLARVTQERDEARDDLRRMVEVRHRGCECSDDDACRFARERDSRPSPETVEQVRLHIHDAVDAFHAGDEVCGMGSLRAALALLGGGR